MCGILGFIAPDRQLITGKVYYKISRDLFLLSESRGKEASGFEYLKERKTLLYKTPYPSSHLVKTGLFKKTFNTNNTEFTRAFIGHSRLVTDGYEHDPKNNQPFFKKGISGVHNGIIVNKENLWEKYEKINEARETDLDSELIPTILGIALEKYPDNWTSALTRLFLEIYGMTSIAVLSDNYDNLFLATNNGSLYYTYDLRKKYFLFASEKYILKKITQKHLPLKKSEEKIIQLKPGEVLSISITELSLSKAKINNQNEFNNIRRRNNPRLQEEVIENKKDVFINTSLEHKYFEIPKEFKETFLERKEAIGNFRRCKKCLLPESFPFIEYDNEGVCNYCKHYNKINYKGKVELCNFVNKYRVNNDSPECLIPFSGGRDSSYALHFVVKELGLKPIAYSYDWGMITDLARRNQARMCGKLGVEHILISADIRKKRANIRKNVLAWLKRPNLGTIPLFMAGDKQYFYYANLLMKQNNLKLSVLGENMLETTNFKTGFCGIKPAFSMDNTYSLSIAAKLKLISFYGKEYLMNPAYINTSLLDTFDAFRSYYIIKHNNLNLYDYIKWDEKKVENTLIDLYDWETDSGTQTTWRIGDGTAAFYNYIYYMLAGFTENDTFRSNQIREGDFTREEALKKSTEENQPRWDSIKWYCDTIQVDFESTIKTINKVIPLF